MLMNAVFCLSLLLQNISGNLHQKYSQAVVHGCSIRNFLKVLGSFKEYIIGRKLKVPVTKAYITLFRNF